MDPTVGIEAGRLSLRVKATTIRNDPTTHDQRRAFRQKAEFKGRAYKQRQGIRRSALVDGPDPTVGVKT